MSLPRISRIAQNQYMGIFLDHMKRVGVQDYKSHFGQPVWPRQMEIHLATDRGKPCNLGCLHCQGQLLQVETRPFENSLIKLINNLDGSIPLFIISGNYSEPTLNVRLIDIAETIKYSRASFGIHTNGTVLPVLQRKNQFISRLVASADSLEDYISVSIDAGKSASYGRIKKCNPNSFFNVVESFGLLDQARQQFPQTALQVRATYLLHEGINDSPGEIAEAVEYARRYHLNSFRFSVPYAPYCASAETYQRHKQEKEIQYFERIRDILNPFLSEEPGEHPYIFCLPPAYQDVDLMDFRRCYVGFYSITLGTDGKFYRCPPGAFPGNTSHVLGDITENRDALLRMIYENQKSGFDPQAACLARGIHCNRAQLEINHKMHHKVTNGS